MKKHCPGLTGLVETFRKCLNKTVSETSAVGFIDDQLHPDTPVDVITLCFLGVAASKFDDRSSNGGEVLHPARDISGIELYV